MSKIMEIVLLNGERGNRKKTIAPGSYAYAGALVVLSQLWIPAC